MIKQCSVNGITIGFEERGTGEPLILIMGLGAPGSKWEPHMRVYEKHFRCICIDNRGSGRSDKPDTACYSITQMAADVIGVMDYLGLESAHLHGISMGGAIAQQIAIAQPLRVRSLVLTSTFPRVNVSFRRAIEVLRDSCGQLDAKTQGRLCQWMIYGFSFQQTDEAYMLDDEVNDAANPNPMPAHAYRAQCNGILQHDLLAQLPRIEAPTLVASGAADLLIPMPLSMELYHALPRAELYLCPNGGHVHHWEALEEFNRVTMNFLLRHCTEKP